MKVKIIKDKVNAEHYEDLVKWLLMHGFKMKESKVNTEHGKVVKEYFFTKGGK